MAALLKNLNPYKAQGSDGMHTHVMKELADELAPALMILFQSSLSLGVVPADWRAAHTTPIFKKGEQYDPTNYRPASLTSVVCKLLEHIVGSAVMRHFEGHGILNDNQHGFRRGRSCETQLLEFMGELTTNWAQRVASRQMSSCWTSQRPSTVPVTACYSTSSSVMVSRVQPMHGSPASFMTGAKPWWWMDLNPPLSASDQESLRTQC